MRAKNLSIVSALLIALISGCGSDDTRPVNPPPVDTTVNKPAPSGAAVFSPSLESLKTHLVNSKTQIDGALATLAKLTSPNTPAADLRSLYNTYGDQLARITQQAEQLRYDADAMRQKRQEYFTAWEQRETDVTNPSIRSAMESRKARLRAAHERISTTSLAAKEAYEPLMRDLQDVRRFLGTDLSPASTAMLGDVSKKANADAATVKQKIDAVIAELDTVIGAAN